MEFVLVGYLINQLTFCGQEEHPGINYELCPDWGQCGFGAGPMDGFWKAASLHVSSNTMSNRLWVLTSQIHHRFIQNVNILETAIYFIRVVSFHKTKSSYKHTKNSVKQKCKAIII